MWKQFSSQEIACQEAERFELKYGRELCGYLIDLYICPNNVYMHQYIWYSDINSDVTGEVNSTDDSTSVMRFGIDDTNLRTIDLYICPNNVYMHQYIWYSDINDSDVTDEVNSTDDSTSEMRFGIDDTNLRTILTCIYVQTTYTCTSIYDIV